MTEAASKGNVKPPPIGDGIPPVGWERVPLGDVAEIKLGKMLDRGKASSAQRLPYLRNVNVRWGQFDTTDLLEMAFEDAELEKFSLKPGDVLVCEGGEPGRAAVWDRADSGIKFQKALHRVRFLGGVLPQWLVHQLKYDADLGHLLAYFTGTTIKHFTRAAISRYVILLAPLAEQKRIVAKVEALLSRVTAAKEQLTQVPVLLKRFRQAVLAAACSGRLTADWRERQGIVDAATDEGELPGSWKRRSLSDLCEGFQYGSSRKSDKEGEVPVLRMGNIQDGEIDWTDLAYSSDDDEIDKYVLAPNTVLFNRTNSPELVGKTGIYRGERSAIFAGYLIRIHHGPEVSPEYLNYCLNAPDFKGWCRYVRTDGVSQSNINAKKLASYEMPWCKLEEQDEIVRCVETLFKLADAIERRVAAAAARAGKLTQAILAKAFRGELVPTEADLARQQGRPYEPASALLARIRAERDAADVKPKAKRTRTAKNTKVPACPSDTPQAERPEPVEPNTAMATDEQLLAPAQLKKSTRDGRSIPT